MSDQAQTTGSPLTAEEVSQEVEQKAQAYWKTNITVIGVLLALWALVSFVFGYFMAVPMSDVNIGQVPWGFWWAQQGAIFVFVLIILAYALIMDRVDRKFDLNE